MGGGQEVGVKVGGGKGEGELIFSHAKEGESVGVSFVSGYSLRNQP